MKRPLAALIFSVSIASGGPQLGGNHTPAQEPALKATEQEKVMHAPEGFEVRLFASEPMVVNPVAMTWGERGRLWVVELFEYPLGAKPGEKGRDRVRILEDTDNDGRADTSVVFADDLNLATGIAIGNGGVYVGQAPDLLFFTDTDGDDRADTREAVLTGFGRQDTHELLNSFAWGPDGMLYLTHGVFTHSKVRHPGDPEDDGMVMNAAVARIDTRNGHAFEVFADGTSNPWGVDFDRAGNAFISACVIDHMFHMAPAGLYQRQGGSPEFAYSYGLLPSIVDHRHHLAAYAGVQVYQGGQYPPEYDGTIFIGNIHANAVHQDILTPVGASFRSSHGRDFLTSEDGWFRPVSTQTGPDGALWVMDWYDKYPCYQNAQADPEGVDREHGRIWRVVHVGDKPAKPMPSHPEGMDLKKAATAELVALLDHGNSWHRRVARRLLSERRDASCVPLLEKAGSLDALWTLHGAGFLTEAHLDRAAASADVAQRVWAARLSGERRAATNDAVSRLAKLASDSAPAVRLAVATALRQYASSHLTINTPVPEIVAGADLAPVWRNLIASGAQLDDPVIPFVAWMALEPRVVAQPDATLRLLRESSPTPLLESLLQKSMRRLCDTRDPAAIRAAFDFTAALESPSLTTAALRGFLEAQKGKALKPESDTSAFFNRIAASDDATLRDLGLRLGALWGDRIATDRLLATAADAGADEAVRVEAIRTSAQFAGDHARTTLLALLGGEEKDAITKEAIRTLARIGNDATGAELIARWPDVSAAARTEILQTIVSRPVWTSALLDAIEKKTIAAGDLPVAVIRSLLASADRPLRDRATALIGVFREPPKDLRRQIVEKRKAVLTGEPDLESGRAIASAVCLTCHKLHGQGATVGPDLTGAGRSDLNALLNNILAPNQLVGDAYELVSVTTKDGRTLSGRMTENSDNGVRILAIAGREDFVIREDVASVEVTRQSVMPEGLGALPDEQFRDLVWFILAPPEDGQPLTPERKRALAGTDPPPPAKRDAVDYESVSLWNPEWRVLCPPNTQSPRVEPDIYGRKNVLVTHPPTRDVPAMLERRLAVPAGKKTQLQVVVQCDPRGDWEFRAYADDELLLTKVIDRIGQDNWKRFAVDLTKFAGREITLTLHNAANDWLWEHGYWGELRLVTE